MAPPAPRTDDALLESVDQLLWRLGWGERLPGHADAVGDVVQLAEVLLAAQLCSVAIVRTPPRSCWSSRLNASQSACTSARSSLAISERRARISSMCWKSLGIPSPPVRRCRIDKGHDASGLGSKCGAETKILSKPAVCIGKDGRSAVPALGLRLEHREPGFNERVAVSSECPTVVGLELLNVAAMHSLPWALMANVIG